MQIGEKLEFLEETGSNFDQQDFEFHIAKFGDQKSNNISSKKCVSTVMLI